MTEQTQPKLVKPGQLYELMPDGRWAFFFDSSTVRSFLSCEMLFYERHVRNIRPRGRKIKTDLGQWWSHTMELYYNALRAGDLTQQKVIEFALHAWSECKMEELKVSFPKSYTKFGGQHGAILMATQYFENYVDVDFRSWKVVSVEEGSGRLREILVGENDKVVVYYIVKPDLFIIEDGKYLSPVDHKTKDTITSELVHTFKPHQQMMGYLVAGQQLATQLGLDVVVDRCMINVAARNEPGPRAKRQDRFLRIPISYSHKQLFDWRMRTIEVATRLRYCFENNVWLWNDDACHKYGGCEFRPLHSTDSEAWPVKIKADYDVVNPWIPYQTEQEEENGE